MNNRATLGKGYLPCNSLLTKGAVKALPHESVLVLDGNLPFPYMLPPFIISKRRLTCTPLIENAQRFLLRRYRKKLEGFCEDLFEHHSEWASTPISDPETKSSFSSPTLISLEESDLIWIEIKAYLIQDYALWEVIENGDSWVSVPQTAQENGTSVTKMSIPVTAEEKTNKKNDVKARTLLLMALPNEHQLTFSQYPDAKSMFAAIETRLGENLNSKFLSSLPSEWNTHVVVWMNKPEVETMSLDDLYNNFKIVKQKVKKSVGTSSGAQNMAFMTASSTSSTNDANTASPQVSTASPNVNAASPQVSTASVSDNIVYAFMVENPNGSNVLHQDLEQIHEDDLEAMDLKWQLSLLSVSAKKYYKRTGKKIFINSNHTTGYDKTKMFKGFDWSDMAEEQVQTNMALMAFSNSEVYTDKTCSKTCLKNYETLKKQCDDLMLNVSTDFTALTYKRGLATLETTYSDIGRNEVLFSEEVAVLKEK
ncbi:hypothetical protein Tco_0596437 [Tanacetum coccineum]